MSDLIGTYAILLVFVGGPSVLLGALIAVPGMIIILLVRGRYIAAAQAIGACVAIYFVCALSFGWTYDGDEMAGVLLVTTILMPIAMVVATYMIMRTTNARPLARSQD